MFNRFGRTTQEIQGSNEFRLIGARTSGKTTYLAALVHWPNAPENSPIEAVDPLDDETGRLIRYAQDILETGNQMAGSLLPLDPNEMPPSYSLSIRLQNRFGRGDKRLNITCKDYPGELFEQLRGGNRPELLEPYLDDCAIAPGLLLMIDGTNHKEDRNYAQALTILQNELSLRLTAQDRPLNRYRIAIAFSKAEQATVWLYRNDINQFLGKKFPQTQRTITRWSRQWRCPIKYFFCSAFGMKGNPPKPNFRETQGGNGAKVGVINRPKFWRPFGLVSPIYWLHTGKEDRRLH
ncbi:hypothetical protein [Crocosphaera sp.]|uniref:hypothetical protein n=1 Tax=Crocosphaera sp. TaxID=2729996 RepID=UPI00260B1093|nr:hypothetical protein [Crocosphaera sp.]MDJ0579203.1 hypothetical protein [Crocosphaera sp.]